MKTLRLLNRSTRIRLASSLVAIVLLTTVAFLLAKPAFSYLPLLTRANGTGNPDHWDFTAFPVTFSINPATNSNITGSLAAADVVNTSFGTWLTAPNTALSVTRGPDTSLSKAGFDGVNLVCFTCTGDFSQDANTLAVTMTTVADAQGQDTKHGGTSRFAGQILDADILFNPSVKFTTGGTAGQDIQTIATHEIGHFFGLDHSAIVRSIMFPFAPDLQTALSYDDVAGISSLYPKNPADVPTGTIAGTIRAAGGGPVFGAHVFADSTTGTLAFGSNIRKSPIGAMSGPDGTYSIQGVPIDSYTVTVEPLDDPVSNSDISGYASAFGKSSVQTNFNTRWH